MTDVGTVVLSIGGGAVGAALIGLAGALLGAAIQSRREHAKWLREKRLETYLAYLMETDRQRTTNQTDIEKYRALTSELALLGTYPVIAASTDMEAARQARPTTQIDVRQEFIFAAQKALKISRWR